MGCASSKVENEEIVARCKGRRRYMKQAVTSRHHFAAAHGCYLQALRNTGAALRQFAEGESMEAAAPSNLQTHHHHLRFPPPLPPPPPPTPPPEMSPFPNFQPGESPYVEASGGGASPQVRGKGEECWTTSQHSNAPPPPPPPAQASAWDFWDPFRPCSPHVTVAEQRRARLEEEQQQQQRARRMEWEEEQQRRARAQEWEETTTITTTSTTTDAEYEHHSCSTRVENNIKPAGEPQTLTDDNSSMVSSWYTKDSDLAMVVSKSGPKDLVAIVRELDEYFLKASSGAKDVSKLLETGNAYFQHAINASTTNSYHSAKVFNALSWKWASKSPLVMITRESVDVNNDESAGIHGSHCSTLERLYAWEKKLYEEVRSGECTKVELNKKLALLRKQEAKGEEEMKVEKTKAAIKRLQSQIMVAFQAVDTTSTAIQILRENELYPQLVELSKGLMHMWRTMYECHQVQNHIVQQLKYLDNLAGTVATSDYHRQATIQLEAEMTAWYNSFCSLIKSQREYMRSLSGWLRLSLHQLENEANGRLAENHPLLYALCEEWQLALDRLPDQSASGAIQSFVTVVHAIVVQQAEEQKQRKKSDNLSKVLEKKLISLRNLERKYYEPYATPDMRGTGSGFDPLAQKKAKIEALKRRVEEEKAKHLKSIRVSRAMTLNNLQTGLPNVFQAMTGFSSVCMQAFEVVYNQTKSFNTHSCITRLS